MNQWTVKNKDNPESKEKMMKKKNKNLDLKKRKLTYKLRKLKIGL